MARLQRARARARFRPGRAAARARPDVQVLLVQSGRVLHGAGGRAARAGGRRDPRPLSGRTHPARGARRDPPACPRADRAARRGSGSASSGPALAEHGIVSARSRTARTRSWRSSQSLFERQIYPVLTPLAVGPGAAVPVHLRPVAQPRRLRPRPEERRGALRTREGARGPAALPPDRQARSLPAARTRAPPLPAGALSEDGDRSSAASSASPATPTSRSRTRPTTCSRRSSWSCAGAGSETWSASRCRARSRAGCSTA